MALSTFTSIQYQILRRPSGHHLLSLVRCSNEFVHIRNNSTCFNVISDEPNSTHTPIGGWSICASWRTPYREMRTVNHFHFMLFVRCYKYRYRYNKLAKLIEEEYKSKFFILFKIFPCVCVLYGSSNAKFCLRYFLVSMCYMGPATLHCSCCRSSSGSADNIQCW